MRLRFYIGRALIALAVCLAGCISVSKTSTGDFDFKERFDKATKEIVARSRQAEDAALKGQRAAVDPKVELFVQRHFVKADELVKAHSSAVRHALAGGSLFNDYAERRATLLDFTLTLQPSLDIVESKFANAMAFPSGKVVLNRPLAEAFDANKEGFDDILLGILIHELMHVRDGHALEQWATADGRTAWAKDKVIGAVSSVTALIPFLTIKYDMKYPITFGATKQLPALSEFAADLGAVSLLDRAGYDGGRYIAFLLELSADRATTSHQGSLMLLRERVECLGVFSESQFEEKLQGIVIGSRDAGDDIVQTLDLRVAYRSASLLDSPEALAKELPGQAKMSASDLRSAVLTLVRKQVYTACAIRHSFPGAALKEGMLMTPTFDLAMFIQHF